MNSAFPQHAALNLVSAVLRQAVVSHFGFQVEAGPISVGSTVDFVVVVEMKLG
jgi:hypothetical protein